MKSKMTETIVISDDGFFNPDEITIGDSEDVFDSIAFGKTFDRIIVLRNRDGPSMGVSSEFIMAKMVQTIIHLGEDKPRCLIFVTALEDELDDQYWTSTNLNCIQSRLTVTCRCFPPSFPLVMSQWSVTALSATKVGDETAPRISNGTSIIVFRYSPAEMFDKIREQLLATSTGPESIFTLAKRIVGTVKSYSSSSAMLNMLSPGDAECYCRVYCDRYATLSHWLPPDALALPGSGMVRITGVSVPVQWDFSGSETMYISSVGPRTHVWTFDEVNKLKSFNNHTDEEMVLENPVPLKRLFFFPNMRSWVLLDNKHLFEVGSFTNVNIPVTRETSVILSNSIVVIRGLQTDTATFVTWNCNDRYNNIVPKRIVGAVIKTIDVMSTS